MAFSQDSLSTPPPFGVTDDGKIKMPEGTKERMTIAGDQFIEGKPKRKTNISPVFVVNTVKGDSLKASAKPNDGDAESVTRKPYKLQNEARVAISIEKEDSLLKLISDENKKAGSYISYWDGLDANGVKRFGEHEIVIRITEKGRSETINRHRFKVKK